MKRPLVGLAIVCALRASAPRWVVAAPGSPTPAEASYIGGLLALSELSVKNFNVRTLVDRGSGMGGLL